LQIHHGAIVDNVFILCEKFDDGRLWNIKALADRNSGNNNNKKNNKNNVGGHLGPGKDTGPKIKNVSKHT